MTVTITSATPHVVTWRAGNSLHIESTRDAVEAWIDDADLIVEFAPTWDHEFAYFTTDGGEQA